MNQATALQSLFARLTEKAFCEAHLPQFDGFMRMALRAQNQCRATLETLAALKNPPLVFAKQANIAHGNQQVNNGIPKPAAHARAGENKIQQNELLTEVQHGTTVDPQQRARQSKIIRQWKPWKNQRGRRHQRVRQSRLVTRTKGECERCCPNCPGY